MFQALDVADMGAGPRVRVIPESGLPQYVRFFVDGFAQSNPVYARTGVRTEFLGVWQYAGTTGHIVNICPQGDWPDKELDLSAQLDAFASGRARRFTIEIDPTVDVYSDSPQLSGWASITGLRRFTNCLPVSGRPTWGRLSYSLSDSGGTRIVTLSNGSTTVSSGSRAGDGSVTLASVTGGVSGDVSVTYTGAESGYVYFTWPAAYAIHWNTGSGFTGADFPRTADATVRDDGQSNTHYYQSTVMSAATYYVVVHQVDDNGNESTGLTGGGTAITVYAPPRAPSGLAYVTGDVSNTTITFSGATGATGYLIYDSHSGVMDLSAPTTAASDSGSQVLTGIVAGYSGYRYVIVRSTIGGSDDGNSDQLRIEYSGGVVVLPRPPAPGVGLNIHTSGRTISIPTTITLAESEANPAYVELFLWRADTGSFDSGSPISTGVIASGTMRVGQEIVITVSGTTSGDGMWYYLARTVTAGGTSSNNTGYSGPVRLTSSQPSGPSAVAARGS
jgi:hypothetical protein